MTASMAEELFEIQTPRTMLPTSHPAPSSLLDLPPELRNIIYNHVLLSANLSHVLNLVPTPHNPSSTATWAPPPLCRVCTQLRLETLPIFYGCHTFRFTAASFYPYFPVLRRALAFLAATSPGVRLVKFELRMGGHYPVTLGSLVDFVRIFGVYRDQLPRGDFTIEFLGEWRASGEPMIMEQRRAEFTTFLRDLSALGKSLGKQGDGNHGRCEQAVCEFFFEDGVDSMHYRRFVVWSSLVHLRQGYGDMNIGASSECLATV